jgi:hypothetical protein
MLELERSAVNLLRYERYSLTSLRRHPADRHEAGYSFDGNLV